MSNDVINAVKRLERVGSETSQSTAKLIEAAKTILQEIDRLISPIGGGGNRPGVVLIPHEVAAKHNLTSTAGTLATRDWVAQSLSSEPDRVAALRLASAVAGGFLDDLAAWAEARIQEQESATRAMSRAAAK